MKIIPSPIRGEGIKSDEELRQYSNEMFDKITPLESNDKKVIEVYIRHIDECFNIAEEGNLSFITALFLDESFKYYCEKDMRLKHLKCLNELAMLNWAVGLQLLKCTGSLEEYDHIYMKLYFYYRRIQLDLHDAGSECTEYIVSRNIPVIFVALVLADSSVGCKKDVLFKLADCYMARGNSQEAMMLLALSTKLIAGAEEEILNKIYSLGK